MGRRKEVEGVPSGRVEYYFIILSLISFNQLNVQYS